MAFCADCISGVRHEGTEEGKIIELGGVKTYEALPQGNLTPEQQKTAILFLPDVFGLGLVNARLLADDFARNGFQTYIPDYLYGDHLHPDALTPGSSHAVNLGEWFPGHTQEKTEPHLKAVIAALKERGITTFGATGYCFGARYVFNLAYEGVIKASVVSHPSLLDESDIEKYSKLTIPLLINSCEFDDMWPASKQAKAQEVLGDSKTFKAPFQQVYWKGCTHGFAVRGDYKNNPEVKWGKEGAFEAAVGWFKKHL